MVMVRELRLMHDGWVEQQLGVTSSVWINVSIRCDAAPLCADGVN